MSPPPPERIGRYRIERKIGEGGMGVVYAAHDERLDRPVALKTIRGESDDDRAHSGCGARPAPPPASATRTSASSTRWRRPTTASSWRWSCSPASRWRPGWLAGRCRAADAAAVSLQTLDALEALHTRGFIHRDLKPSNLFLTPHGVKLLDFGLARPMGGRAVEATPATRADRRPAPSSARPNYMAPEQVRGEPLDGRADLFAMAALLFEMLSGSWPSPARRWWTCCTRCCTSSRRRSRAAAAVAGLDRVVHKALQKQAADRYESAAAMAAAIRG